MECEKPVEIIGTFHFQSFILTSAFLLENYDACNMCGHNFIDFYIFIFQQISDSSYSAVVSDTSIPPLAELENETRIVLNSINVR